MNVQSIELIYSPNNKTLAHTIFCSLHEFNAFGLSESSPDVVDAVTDADVMRT